VLTIEKKINTNINMVTMKKKESLNKKRKVTTGNVSKSKTKNILNVNKDKNIDEINNDEDTDDETKIGDEIDDDEMKKDKANNAEGIEIVNGIDRYLDPVQREIMENEKNEIIEEKEVSSNKHIVPSVLSSNSPDSHNESNKKARIDEADTDSLKRTLNDGTLPSKNLPPVNETEVSMKINTHVETISGFTSKGKQAMVDSLLTSPQQMLLRGMVKTKIFRMLKFIGPDRLAMNSTIMEHLYSSIHVTDHNEKCQLHDALRYILQRQLNSKRDYCISKMVNQMKGMNLNLSKFFLTA
jgi:hypothetical protein